VRAEAGPGPARALPGMDVAGRLERLRPLLGEAGADSLLVTTLPNIRYLTGFSGSAALLLVTETEALLVTDGRYRTQAAEQVEGAGVVGSVELVIGGGQAQRDAVVTAATDRGGRVGLESENVSWGSKRRWAGALGSVELVATAGVVERLRLVKDAGEVARMAAAAAIADAALGEILGMVGEGRSEQEVALALDTAMRRLGSDDRAFETIVASGPNAAKPHARPGPRTIGPGDPVVIDFGATFDGYRSDMTRTFCVGGNPAPELARVFEVVAEAQAAGVKAVAAGVVSGEIDRVCRDRIAESGWGAAFEHGTGHGVGLDIHEAPSVAQGSTAILTPGVVVTVEPGIYLAGVGGVRIEDTVVVTDQGCRPLTEFTKDIAA
jgi:Xaa-Pro aminopeptidase